MKSGSGQSGQNHSVVATAKIRRRSTILPTVRERCSWGVMCMYKEWGRHIQGPPPPIPPDNVHSIKILSTLENCGPSEHVGTSTTGKCYGVASHWSSSPLVQVMHGRVERLFFTDISTLEELGCGLLLRLACHRRVLVHLRRLSVPHRRCCGLGFPNCLLQSHRCGHHRCGHLRCHVRRCCMLGATCCWHCRPLLLQLLQLPLQLLNLLLLGFVLHSLLRGKTLPFGFALLLAALPVGRPRAFTCHTVARACR
mmetsp:Transcript_62529/g.103078  ORF Transcript_62529/g.103078 Transcript_62529/m.103078 type:complete len:253 (-) Transcript_62529:1680-2438(-)